MSDIFNGCFVIIILFLCFFAGFCVCEIIEDNSNDLLTENLKYNSDIHDCNKWICKRAAVTIFGVPRNPSIQDLEYCGSSHWIAVCKNWSRKEKSIEEKYWDLYIKINKKEFELYSLRRGLSILKADLEAKQKNLTVKYQPIPNSTWIMRIEYNGSEWDSIDISEIYENSNVKVRK